MPRIPQIYDRVDYCCPHREVIVDNSNVDIKLKLLQEKLNEEIDKKQNKLIAGENIIIENDVISATCRGSEPEAYIKSAEVSEDGNTLTLTNKDDTTVEFSPKHGDDVFDEYFQADIAVGNLPPDKEVFPGTTVKDLLIEMLKKQEPVGIMFAFFYDGGTPLEEGE